MSRCTAELLSIEFVFLSCITCRLVFSYFLPHFIIFRCASISISSGSSRTRRFFCSFGLFLSSLKTKAWEPRTVAFLFAFPPVPLVAGVPSTRSSPARNLFFYYEHGSGCPPETNEKHARRIKKGRSKIKEGSKRLAVGGLIGAGLKIPEKTALILKPPRSKVDKMDNKKKKET